MRISDWSSDVCSSDLLGRGFSLRPEGPGGGGQLRPLRDQRQLGVSLPRRRAGAAGCGDARAAAGEAGLSERLIRSHWENNYIGSVKALNLIEARLAAAMADPDFPPVVYGGLKREQPHRTGSVILHEHDPAR